MAARQSRTPYTEAEDAAIKEMRLRGLTFGQISIKLTAAGWARTAKSVLDRYNYIASSSEREKAVRRRKLNPSLEKALAASVKVSKERLPLCRLSQAEIDAAYAGQKYEDDPRADTKADRGFWPPYRLPSPELSYSPAGCGLAGLKGSGL